MKIKHIAVATILSVAAASALAGDWYVVGSIGQSKIKDKGNFQNNLDGVIPGGATLTSSSMDDTDTSYKLQLGYKFTPNWAIEGGYVDLGKFNYSATFTPPVGGSASGEVKVHGWNIAGVGTMPINDQFSLFGKLGLIDAKFEGSASDSTGTGGGGSVSKSKTKANYGVGATYNVTKQWGVRAEWERFNKLGDKDTIGESDFDLLSVGVVLNF